MVSSFRHFHKNRQIFDLLKHWFWWPWSKCHKKIFWFYPTVYFDKKRGGRESWTSKINSNGKNESWLLIRWKKEHYWSRRWLLHFLLNSFIRLFASEIFIISYLLDLMVPTICSAIDADYPNISKKGLDLTKIIVPKKWKPFFPLFFFCVFLLFKEKKKKMQKKCKKSAAF